MKLEKYIPMGDRCLVQQLPDEPQNENGIIVSQQTIDAMPLAKGVVMAIGEGIFAKETGELIPTTLKIGDKVLILRNADYPAIILNGVQGKLMFEGDVQGII